MEKKCSVCKETKSTDEFNKNKSKADGLQARCRKCQKAGYAEYYATPTERARLKANNARRALELREMADKIKKVPCADCGHDYPPYVMDFDHVGTDKIFNIGTAVGQRLSFANILAEIEKCEVVCSNCHRIRTHERMGA